MKRWKLPVRWLVPFLLGVVVGVGTAALFLARPPLWARPFGTLARIEATIYLPTRNNGNKPFSEEQWHAALQVLVAEFGGATIGPPMEGYWSDKGRLFREPVRLVTVSFDPERLKRFRQLVREVARRLGQESIYTHSRSRASSCRTPKTKFELLDPAHAAAKSYNRVEWRIPTQQGLKLWSEEMANSPNSR